MYKAIIIEDDPMVTAINEQYTKKNPKLKVIRTFTNGQDALDYLKGHTVDLAIVDYYMPVINGLEFIHICRKENIHVDIIMITANNNASEISEVMLLGVIDYLIKPFTYERFAEAIQKFINKRTALQTGGQLSQEELDKALSAGHPELPAQNLLDKGLQQKTLELILDFLDKHPYTWHSSEEIAREVKLSRITVRRYMNYLLESNKITSQIDYNTGGRPSIKYRKT